MKRSREELETDLQIHQLKVHAHNIKIRAIRVELDALANEEFQARKIDVSFPVIKQLLTEWGNWVPTGKYSDRGGTCKSGFVCHEDMERFGGGELYTFPEASGEFKSLFLVCEWCRNAMGSDEAEDFVDNLLDGDKYANRTFGLDPEIVSKERIAALAHDLGYPRLMDDDRN